MMIKIIKYVTYCIFYYLNHLTFKTPLIMRTIIRVTKIIVASLIAVLALFMLSYGIKALLSPDTYFLKQATDSTWDKTIWLTQSLTTFSALGIAVYMMFRKTSVSRIDSTKESRTIKRFGMAFLVSAITMSADYVYIYMLGSPL